MAVNRLRAQMAALLALRLNRTRVPGLPQSAGLSAASAAASGLATPVRMLA